MYSPFSRVRDRLLTQLAALLPRAGRDKRRDLAVDAAAAQIADGAPAGLKERTLALAGGESPDAAEHQAAVLGRAGSFGRHGFPRPMRAP